MVRLDSLIILAWLVLGPALLFHALGWIVVAGVFLDALYVGRATVCVTAAMKAAYVGSIVGFLLGLATLPLLFTWDSYFGPAWLAILLFGRFPYVPSVFSPIVAFHAILFVLGVRTTTDRLAQALLMIAGSALLILATLALGNQLNTPDYPANPLQMLLAGLTSIGYGCAAAGWWRSATRGEAPTRLQPPRFNTT